MIDMSDHKMPSPTDPLEEEDKRLLAGLVHAGRMVVQPDHQRCARRLVSYGLASIWGVPDMMVFQPTPLGVGYIQQQELDES